MSLVDAVLLQQERALLAMSPRELRSEGRDPEAIRGARRKSGPKGRFTDDQVRRIRAALADGMTQQEVAERFNATRPMINAIACGRAYARVR